MFITFCKIIQKIISILHNLAIIKSEIRVYPEFTLHQALHGEDLVLKAVWAAAIIEVAALAANKHKIRGHHVKPGETF